MTGCREWSSFPITPLGRLASIYPSNVDKVVDQGERLVQLCNYVNVYNNERITGKIPFPIGSALPREIAKFALQADDVLITKDSESPEDIAVPALVDESAAGVICGYHLAILRTNPNRMRGDYLFWSLKSRPVKESFSIRAQGITRFGLTRNGISTVLVPTPDLLSQRAISNFLDRETARIDQLIEKKLRLAQLIEERFDSVVSQAVTGHMNDHVDFASSGVPYLGAVPRHWTVTSVSNRYWVQLGKMLDSARVSGLHLRPYLRVFDVQWGRINVVGLPQMDFSEADRQRYSLRKGDLLVNEGGSYVGRSAIWEAPLKECYYQKALHRLRPRDPERDTTRFFYFVMWFATKLGVFVAGGNQTTIDHLTAESLRRYRFAFPPIEEQLRIAENLNKAEIQTAALNGAISASIDHLRELRVSLITAAVTGQIDVATWSKRGETERRLEAIEHGLEAILDEATV